MHYFFDLFDKICVNLDSDPQNLRNILNEYDFKHISTPSSPLSTGKKYLETIYSKEHETYSLTIKLATNIKYTFFSHQEDSYHITVSLYENDNIINSKTYKCNY